MAAARKATEEGGRLFSKEAMEEFEDFDAVDEATVGGTPGLWDTRCEAICPTCRTRWRHNCANRAVIVAQ